MSKTKCIAHRGLSDTNLWAPENSAESFRRAVLYGFAVEFDVHLSKDNKIVVFHDDNLLRMTGVNKKITSLTLSQLKELRLADTSEKIPTLSEALSIIDGRVPLYIEIKNTTFPIGKIERILLSQMKNYKGKWTVMAFNPFRLNWMSKHSNVRRYQLVASKKKKGFAWITRSNFVWKNISKPHILGFCKDTSSIDTALVCAKNNCEHFVWTVKTQKECDKFSKYCDGITFEGFIPNKKHC